jgi:hypothetical protein
MKIDVYAEGEGQKEHLATFTLTNIDDIAKNDIALKEGSTKPKVTLSFELTRSGLIQLNKAEVKIDETYTVEEKIVKPLNKSATNATDDTTSEPEAEAAT